VAQSSDELEDRLVSAELQLGATRRKLRQRRLLRYTADSHWRYDINWHHELLADRLERIASGEIERLIIAMPPRHGKSELASRRFPAWLLGRNPHEQLIVCSYSASLASSLNRDVQKIMSESVYHDTFPATRLSRSNVVTRADLPALRNSTIFEVVGARGYFLSAGVGGPITGRGMTLGIIDDPIKNREEANSPTIREKIWNWYTSTFLTREEARARIVIIMTRWHEDDLVGRVLRQAKETGEHWHVLSLPAVLDCPPCEGDTRKLGDPLWPKKYDAVKLDRRRKAIGEFEWLSLYQQRPTPIGGGIFQRVWWRHCEERERPTRFDHVWQSWDLGFKKEGRSRVAGLVFAARGAKLYILDAFVDHLSYVETRDAIRRTTERHPQAYAKVVEDRANGPAIMSDLAGELGGFISWPPKGVAMDDKVARASAASPVVRAGDVTLPPRSVPWVDGFIEELASFPAGLYDDQVDAFSQGIAYWRTTPQAIRVLEALTS
jgi:predicted phage terminase large subunit-like protein